MSVRALGVATVVCAWAAAAARPGVVRRQVEIGAGQGTVTVEVPAGWRFEVFPHDSPPSATVRFGPPADDVEFTLGLLWTDPSMRASPEALKERVRLAANEALRNAAETRATLVEIRGKETTGYSYSLTHPASAARSSAGRFVTQGMAVTGPVTNVFTLSSRSAETAERERALRVIASARWSQGAARGAPARVATASGPLSLRVEETGQAYRLTVPVSHFVLTIRRGELKRGSTPPGASPHTFLLNDEERGIVVAGSFELSERFEGLEKVWRHERNAQDATFTKVGGWDAMAYDEPARDGTRAHVRAEWVSEGTWIDLQLSRTAKPAALAEARESLLQLLDSFRVEDKD